MQLRALVLQPGRPAVVSLPRLGVSLMRGSHAVQLALSVPQLDHQLTQQLRTPTRYRLVLDVHHTALHAPRQRNNAQSQPTPNQQRQDGVDGGCAEHSTVESYTVIRVILSLCVCVCVLLSFKFLLCILRVCVRVCMIYYVLLYGIWA